MHIHDAHPGHSLNQADDMRRACDLICKGTFRNRELVTHEYKLSEIQKAFEKASIVELGLSQFKLIIT